MKSILALLVMGTLSLRAMAFTYDENGSLAYEPQEIDSASAPLLVPIKLFVVPAPLDTSAGENEMDLELIVDERLTRFAQKDLCPEELATLKKQIKNQSNNRKSSGLKTRLKNIGQKANGCEQIDEDLLDLAVFDQNEREARKEILKVFKKGGSAKKVKKITAKSLRGSKQMDSYEQD